MTAKPSLLLAPVVACLAAGLVGARPAAAAPRPPSGLTAVATSCGAIALGWTGATGDPTVAGYAVYRNGVFRKWVPVPATSTTDTGLAASTTYAYTISAVDRTNLWSAPSAPARATTPSCAGGGPAAPAGLRATATGCGGIALTWSASASPGVSGYRVYRNGLLLKQLATTATSDTGLAPATTYTYAVSAVDGAGRESSRSAPATATTLACSDTTAPSVPTGVTASATACNGVTLRWSPSSDGGGSGLRGYRMYRDGVLMKEVPAPATETSDGGLAAARKYTYAMSAIDKSGNESAKSLAASATTPPCADTGGPSTPAGLTATAASCSRIDLRWTASTVGDSPLYGYVVYRNGFFRTWVAAPATSMSETGLAASATYTYTLAAVDQTGKWSAASAAATATTPACSDSSAPAVPTGLTVTAASCTTATLAWSATTDSGGSGLEGYRIYRNGVLVRQVAAPATTASETGLAPATAYTYALSAIDKAGNESAKGAAASATTPACPDATAPSVPTGLTASASGCNAIALAWTASTDTGGSGVEAYRVFRNGVLAKEVAAPATSTSDGGLAASTAYTYAVSAVDKAGNESARSASAGATTAACTNLPPLAKAGPDQLTATLTPLTFNAAASSDPDGTITSWAWTFGDGGTASGVSVSHAYDTAGTYTVTLTVTDSGGLTASDTASVTVTNRPPVAAAGPDRSVAAGSAVAFDGSGSDDADGTIASYRWAFGDGTTATGRTASHAYASAGTYTVTLTVTDNQGATGTDSAVITVGGGGGGSFNPELIGFVPGVGTARDVAVDAGLKRAYVASAEFGLAVVDLAAPDLPTLLGSADVPFAGETVAVAGTRAVVTGFDHDDQPGLWVLDTTNSRAPTVVGHLAAPAVPAFEDVALAATGTLAVVTVGPGGLWTVDLTNPAAPRKVGSLDTPGHAGGVAVDAARAYVADGLGGLTIVDLTTPAAPTRLGSITFPGMLASDVTVAGPRAYVADASWRLFVLDVATPSAPTVLGHLTLSGAVFHVSVAGARAAVIAKGPFEDFLEVVDVTAPAAPARRATLSLGPPASAQGVALTATHAYVGNTTEGLRAFDLANPAAPSPRGAAVESFLALALATAPGRAVVAGTDRFDNVAVLKVLDTSDPTRPAVVGTLSTSAAATFRGVAVNAAGTLAVATLGTAGVWTIDLTDPANPRRLGSLDTPGDAWGIALTATHAYVADGLAGLTVLDVRAPQTPVLVATKAGTIARQVAVAGTMAYVGDLSGYLFLFDVATPAAPTIRTNTRLAGPARHLAMAGTRVALVTTSPTADNFELVDVSAPAAPVVQATRAVGPVGSAQGVALAATRAYVAATGTGLLVFDLTTPTAPKELAAVPTVGDPLGVALDDDLACVADFPATLSVIDLFAP